ncbi:rRNA methylase [Hyella patelloides LEGE 07179]|uniref:rRNA methylase n=1 Tax=Hyella patelloides LEGE 07179 TaxID=945734 RepID=A0A563VWF3_9CYAN|nr:RNA methyltransferase [Hyella patelloides]VEP15583.1 rRNA methylase [Hyella patelloides LEGE 07179]
MVDLSIDSNQLEVKKALTEVAQLQSNRAFRDRNNLFYIEGVRNFIQVAENNFQIATILYSEKLLIVPPARKLVRSLRRNGVKTIKLTPEEFRIISHAKKASGIAAIVHQKWTKLHQASPNTGLCWIALEKVRHPGNLGTLIRTSEAIGGGGFIFIGKNIDPYAPDAIRATMGALFHQTLIRTTYSSLEHWICRHNCGVVGASLAGNVDFHCFKYPRSTIIFLGEERKGLSKNQQDLCHHLIRIPMVGKSDSLNLAVAGSLLLYEVYKSKTNSKSRKR